jgi:hypothetical protein
MKLKGTLGCVFFVIRFVFVVFNNGSIVFFLMEKQIIEGK